MQSKERAGRLAVQEEVTSLKNQLQQLEQRNVDLEREVKTIAPLTESNEITKADLQKLRQRYKEDKSAMTKQNKGLENKARELEQIKNDVRIAALRIVEYTGNNGKSNGGSGSNYNNGGNGGGKYRDSNDNIEHNGMIMERFNDSSVDSLPTNRGEGLYGEYEFQDDTEKDSESYYDQQYDDDDYEEESQTKSVISQQKLYQQQQQQQKQTNRVQQKQQQLQQQQQQQQQRNPKKKKGQQQNQQHFSQSDPGSGRSVASSASLPRIN
jgi:hypothetical protein